MEKTIEQQSVADNESSVFIRITMNQIVGFILGALVVFSPLVWEASNYATQFQYLKSEVTENKIVNQQLAKSMQELTLEIKSLRIGLEDVNQRRSTTSAR